MEVSKKQDAGSLIPPRKTAAIEALLKVNKVDHPIAQKYLQEFELYQKNLEQHISNIQKKENIILPELKPIDPESLYNLFKDAFKFFNGKVFDENCNDGEGRKLARTLCTFFLERKGFYHSPIINNKSVPDLEKGLMIIGTYGTGKTSILNTFNLMFSHANSHPIIVMDVENNKQFLGRYRLGFGYFTANEVVKEFEGLSDRAEKTIFWNRHKKGTKYYDDIMTESTASNYGKIEIFKDIFEMRYSEGVKTIISLNYSGGSVDETLEEISRKYGERVYDRLFEMFNIIELKGESLRR